MNLRLVSCILVPIIIGGALNGYLLSRRKVQEKSKNPALPPGWTVGLIWTILFGIIGYIFYLYFTDPIISISIIILFVSCLAYPFYTDKFKSKRTSTIGNTLTLIDAFILTVILAIRSTNKQHVYLMVPFLIWASYVNVVETIQ